MTNPRLWRNVVGASGIVCVAVGLWMLSVPACLIVMGTLLSGAALVAMYLTRPGPE